ncbi:sorbitol dehydrogenase-like [Argiope bruennichi]|uniref:Sorbitol dehydrogenase n=1 Tax=Argiope bruennichi TaxID=94029 RepID=A0A8T0G131_ARGBR|nr:sorbitol dehydrogenase-like [Argiope bruennichi]KAF8795539.1 Sorbitol dehydrogenase like protein [Argiope bruennichi]
MTTKNFAAVLRRKGELVLENRNVPEPLSHEVLISIHTVGICGSDVHYWKHGQIGDFIVKEPMILGHESSGTVIKTGNQVKHLKPGDRVCIEPGVPCRRCEFCLGGRYNLCPDIKFCATPPVDGSLCQYYCHDAAFCYKLPENVSLEEGALMEPLSVAVHACRRAQVTAGKSVLICGAGPIGLVNLLTCKAMGATKICITDISENRLDIAKKLGATFQINVKDLDTKTAVSEIKSLLGGSPDITIECSGAELSIRLALLVAKSGGVVMCVGLGAPEIKIPIIEASVREVDIKGIFRYANCYPTAIGLVSSGAIDVKPLITHHFNLENMLAAFETSASGAGGAIKVLIHCSE